MATKRKLQVRYGAAASRPTLSTGELGLDTDTGSEALYIGTPAGNKNILSLKSTEKRYFARVFQSDSDPVESTPYKNTLGGTVVWTKQSAGIYWGTLSGAFTAEKTSTVPYTPSLDDSYSLVGYYKCEPAGDTNKLILTTVNLSGTPSDGIIEFTPALIDITVYP